jgi:LuxR family maltose regulon positive regulatory protein
LLEAIEARNLFLIPLDTTRTWYRYHRLFAELLRRELELADPAAARDLHRRACEWYRVEGSIPDAIHHAIAAGDIDRARELVASGWNEYFNQGRLGTVTRWLDSLPGRSVKGDPRLCVARAWLALDHGRLQEAGEWIEAADRASANGLVAEPDEPANADVGVLRAVHGYKVGELSAAHGAAMDVLQLAHEDSFPRTVAKLILGVTLYWNGELDRAAEVLADAAGDAEAQDNQLGQSYALGYLALIEADRGHPGGADRRGAEAIELSDSPGFSEHFVLMVGHLARSRAAEARGRLDEAEVDARRALELAGRGAGRLEVAAAHLALARVAHLRGAPDEARAQLREARRVLAECAEQGALAPALGAAERGLRMAPRGAALASPRPAEEVTDRELAVLRLLASDLSRREIAAALYVSQNTVKTHARAIYRKLDASNRQQAVSRARQLGLL